MAEQQVQKQHPVPQEVLGVQFKIVGELTLRQFAILALFGGLAYGIFSLPNVNPLIKFPLAGISLLIGVGFSLVPIQDQPLDRWLANFFRTIYSPTRRVWRKSPEPLEFLIVPIPKLAKPAEEGISPEEAQQRLKEYLATVEEKEALSPVDLAEKERLEFLNLELREAATEAGLPSPPPPKLPFPKQPFPIRRSEEVRKPSLASTINYTAEPIVKVQRGEEVTYLAAIRNIKVGRRFSSTPAAGTIFAPAKEKVIEPALPTPPSITEIAPPPSPPFKEEPTPPKKIKPVAPPPKPKPKLEEAVPKPPPVKIEKPAPPTEVKPPPTPAPPPLKLRPKKAVPKPPPPPVGAPNTISGTVYDEEGKVLEGVVIAVNNQDGLTVKATKTNQLGQFSLSPLPDGNYTLELPRTKLAFDIMRVELTGERVSPLEIRAKP